MLWFIIAQTRAKSSDLEYFCCFVQNITYGAFFPLSFCQKIQISYQNLKILRNIDFWNSLSSYMLNSIVNFKILCFSIFLDSHMKFVFFDKNWVGKMPHKWYFWQIIKNIPNQMIFREQWSSRKISCPLCIKVDVA